MPNELTNHANRLKELHAGITAAINRVLSDVIEAGRILSDVKLSLPHGQFSDWVSSNAGFNIRTAQRYMKIYAHRDELKNDSVSLMTDAHRFLSAPKVDEVDEVLLKNIIDELIPRACKLYPDCCPENGCIESMLDMAVDEYNRRR